MTVQARSHSQVRRDRPENLQPDLLIEYLYYAFQDARVVSELGARQLHEAITTLAREARPSRRKSTA